MLMLSTSLTRVALPLAASWMVRLIFILRVLPLYISSSVVGSFVSSAGSCSCT
jgi:hypothetical protein